MKHVANMHLEFREGRAKQAAQLHSIGKLGPQREFREGGIGDRWDERGEARRWVRLHKTPRTALFAPRGIPHGPGKKSRLWHIRETIGIDEAGQKFTVLDDWTESRTPPVRSRRWTGITIFHTEGFDDERFGGDQRRQRDRVGIAASPSSGKKAKKLIWADEVDTE